MQVAILLGISFAQRGTMNKFSTLLFFIAIFFIACNNKNNSPKEKKISKRDYSITKKNAYNNLFLDSNEVESFILKNNIPDSSARRVRSFYNTRNYEFAWFSTSGLTEQAYGFWSLVNYSGDTVHQIKALKKTMNGLMANDSLRVSSRDKFAISTELMLTENLITYTRSNYEKGYVKRKEMERFIPFKKQDALYLADSLLNKKHNDDKYFSDVNAAYKLLSEQLKKYAAIARTGGWPSIPANAKNYKAGGQDSGIIQIKKFFEITGDLTQHDTTDVYNENLQNAIKNFQKRYGYTADGKLSSAIMKEMNVSAIARVKQILINMNRMRWMPQEPAGQLILVNIPEFILHVYNDKRKVFDMNVVVGKEGHNTTIFSDKLTTIVFSPYWNVPSSIVKKEILPGMDENKNYLEEHNMEIYGELDGLPAIRQKPGGDNSLGKVKFLFPNNFNIYFHDTPAKGLFDKDVRAYSHGCIRLSEPRKLAEYLLRDNSNWTKEKINESMNGDEEKYAAVKHPVPVFITYYTAWVSDDGVLNFRNDIYGHDKEIADKMFN